MIGPDCSDCRHSYQGYGLLACKLERLDLAPKDDGTMAYALTATRLARQSGMPCGPDGTLWEERA